MANVGIYSGLSTSSWHTYPPKLRGFVSPSNPTPTQPILSDPRNSFGKWLKTNQGLVVCKGSITFTSADSFGSGDDVWGISLPFPANRSNGGADLPIGSAWANQDAAGGTSQLVQQFFVSLMDPLVPGGSQGAEDNYLQMFISDGLLAYGTGAFASSATTCTIDASAQLGTVFTPNAYDIQIRPTNTPSTNPQWISVQNINSGANSGTGKFDVVIKTASTTTPVQFAYAIRAWPQATGLPLFNGLVNHSRPWVWAAGHKLSWSVRYEARG